MELWDLYTKEREKTGETMRRGDPIPEGLYHLVVHVCIFNQKGEMLIQQRQPFKSGWSNMWDVTVGGSATAGDSSSTAAERELREEMGLDLSFADRRPSLTIHFKGGFDDIYLIRHEVEPSALKLQYEEVQTVKWANADEIKTMIDGGSFIPYHKSFIDMLFFLLERDGTHTRGDSTKQAKQ